MYIQEINNTINLCFPKRKRSVFLSFLLCSGSDTGSMKNKSAVALYIQQQYLLKRPITNEDKEGRNEKENQLVRKIAMKRGMSVFAGRQTLGTKNSSKKTNKLD